MNNFDNRLNVLLDFFKTDEVLSNIHNQLINTTKVDLDTWYNEVKKQKLGWQEAENSRYL